MTVVLAPAIRFAGSFCSHLPKSPYPPNHYDTTSKANPFTDQVPNISDAYDAVLAFETAAWQPDSRKLKGLTYARLLEQLLLQAPSDHGRTSVADDILAYARDFDRLHELADSWNSHFARACAVSYLTLTTHTVKAAACRTPTPESGSWDSCSDPMHEESAHELQEQPKRHAHAKTLVRPKP